MAPRKASLKIPVSELEKFCRAALRKAGVSENDACITADVLVTTDSWGVFTHGMQSLRGYVRRLRAGGLKANAVPTVVKEEPGWALIDGDSGLGMVTAVFAMRTAMAKARSTGIAYAGVRNSCHFGAAGFYAMLAAQEGFFALAMSNDIPTVSAPGARGPVLGSNPFAFACPGGKKKPILLDMATSTVAGGKVFAAAARGQKIPSDWIVDRNGLPTDDPTRFPGEGALTPMAGHKGYGLALMVEVLSAVVTGAAMTRQVVSWMSDDPALPTGHGAAFFALDLSMITSLAEFEKRIEDLIAELAAAPRAAGAERIYLPGEMEWDRRERALRDGIELPEDVLESLRGLVKDLEMEEKLFDRSEG